MNIIFHYLQQSFFFFLSDLLHVLKSVCILFIWMISYKNEVMLLLNLPKIVFSNDIASKMHDKLSLILSKLKKLEILHKYNRPLNR